MPRRSVSPRVVATALVAVLLPLPPVFAQGETFARVGAGFAAKDFKDYPLGGTGIGGIDVSGEGHPIVYANGDLEYHGPEGVRVLAGFEPAVYGSFVRLSPDGTHVYFGESSEWNIYSVPLEGGPPELVDRLQNAFDLEFDDSGRGFVSALRNNPANEIVLLDGDPTAENEAVITNIPGVSGPIEFDADGNLYYGTAGFSDDPIRQTLHRFTREQLDNGVEGDPIDFSEGEVLLEEMDGFYNLLWHEGKLYFSELGFTAGTGTVQVIEPERNFLVSQFASFPMEMSLLSPTCLAFLPGERSFVAGSGPRGGSLLVAYSNYSTVLRIAEISPELHFIRGEMNGDGVVDVSDPIVILGYLFLGEAAPDDIEAADANADGDVDLTDAVFILNFLFSGGETIPPPYPERGPAPSA